MTEVVQISLENEMDLVLCHRRSMKLAELCGMSIIHQTSFATAVSEICRCVISRDERQSLLSLGIQPVGSRKLLVARLTTTTDLEKDYQNAIKYARRLSASLRLVAGKKETEVTITEKINFSGLLNDSRIEAFIQYFKKEPPLSPYDEIRKKNIQLLEMSERLRESEDKYRNLTETLPVMIFTTSASGYLTYANQSLIEYFSFLEIIPGKILWTHLADMAEHKALYDAWEKAQMTETALRTEIRLKARPGGEPVWHLISVIPVKNDTGQITGWTGIFVDIQAQKLIEETLKNNTELKIAQKQLLNSQEKLEKNLVELSRSNHDLEQFAYIASHDLQEPLRKITNFTELLKNYAHDPAAASKYLEKIDAASMRMSALITDVLNYSRLSKVSATFEETDLNDTLRSVLTDLELIIEEKKAVVKADRLPRISGIPQQMHQLFYNLVNNALKFNKGTPKISISCHALKAEEVKTNPDLHHSVDYIQVNVADNGIGFDQKYATQVFTIFKRLNNKDAFSGTGIGLALCKKIVDNHHGQISVVSSPGQGTTFSIILPVS
ncbi:MAG: PAS domain S-box protein [Bacteroidetes bacterium]|nr:PAS domain S-box protein [Bacteroidota bacterium]